MLPVVLIVVNTPANWRTTRGFFCISLGQSVGSRDTTLTTQWHLQQAEHASSKRDGSASDDAFAHTAHVIASAARLRKSKERDRKTSHECKNNFCQQTNLWAAPSKRISTVFSNEANMRTLSLSLAMPNRVIPRT
jgi:hypothetical protein